MELEKFKNADKSELSMIEVAHAILHENGTQMAFDDLVNEIQEFLGKSNQEIRDRLPQFYTDLNFDGSFISLGNNEWGLRSWFPYDSIDEALVHSDDEEDEDRPRKKRNKVNAYLADDADEDDVIDYNNDDPEDDDLDSDFDSDDDSDDDEDHELKAYSQDLDDIDSTDDGEDELPDGIEGQLSELNDDDLDDSDEEL